MTSAPRSPRPANCEGGGLLRPRPDGGMCDSVLAPSTWSGDTSPLCGHCALTAGIYKVTGAALKYYICDSIKHFVQWLLDAAVPAVFTGPNTINNTNTGPGPTFS